jgi:hypothetical protein
VGAGLRQGCSGQPTCAGQSTTGREPVKLEEMVIWSLLFDQELLGHFPEDARFTSVGLRRPDGSARPAWDAWLAAD